MEVIDLGGHSGCKIMLYETSDNKRFVRKISSSVSYNKRLEIQAEKQKNFKNEYIKVPDIFDKGYTKEGLFYFDMEFIQGVTLSKYIESVEISKIKELVKKIINYIKNEKGADSETHDIIFKKKIESLNKKLKNKSFVINEALKILDKHSWKNFQKSFCHGDLTLENIIIKNDQLYLIDFLDSFYDCWILDISTLLQDVELLWSYRYEEKININTILRLLVFKDILIDEIKDTNKFLNLEVYYGLLLKIIRIFPYAKDNLTFCFLENKTKYVIDIIKKEEKNENINSTLCRN